MKDEIGRPFCFVCPDCDGDVEGCPDPACENEGVGHHVEEQGEFSGCSVVGVKLDDCQRRYAKEDE